jgi:hypothetical protein
VMTSATESLARNSAKSARPAAAGKKPRRRRSRRVADESAATNSPPLEVQETEPLYDPDNPPEVELDEDEFIVLGSPISAFDMLSGDYKYRPVEPIIEGVLDPGGTALIAAPAKSYKSFFALQLGLSIAAGVPFLGMEIDQPRRVLYVNLEIAEHRLQERLRKLRNGMGEACPRESLRNLVTWSPDRRHRPQFDNPAGRPTDRPRNKLWEILHDARNSLRPFDVVIIDPLRRVHAKQENDSREMQEVFNAIDDLARSGPAVIVLHHAGKPGLDGASKGQHTPRGTSDFEGWPDSLIWFEPVAKGQPRTFSVGTALRDGEELSFHFTVVVDYVEDSMRLELAPNTSGRKVKATDEEIEASIRAVVASAADADEELDRAELTNRVEATLNMETKSCARKPISTAITRMAMSKAISSHKAKGRGGRYFYEPAADSVIDGEVVVRSLPPEVS